MDRTLRADIVNDGTFTVEPELTAVLDKSLAVFSNNGTVDIATTATVTFGAGSVFDQNAGGVLNNNGSFLMGGNTFNYNGGSITGNAIMLVNSTLNIAPGSTGTGDFIMQSSGSGGGSYSGDLAAAQTLTLLGTDLKAATITAGNGFSNFGTISLDSAGTQGAFFTISNGSLTNTAGGEIVLRTGSGTNVDRALRADVINDGMFTVEADVNAILDKQLGVFTNNNTVNIAGTATVTFGMGSTFTQNAGGVLNNNGTFEMAGDTFNYNGGNITGNPIMFMNNTLNIAPGSTGAGDFIFQSFSGGASTLSGDLAAAQTLTIRGNDNSPGQVNVAAGFSNFSTITLDSIGSRSSILTVNNDSALTNTAGGEIALRTGTGSDLERMVRANIVNDGLVTIEPGVAASFDKQLGVFTNNNTVNIAATAAVTFGMGSTFTQNAGGVLNNNGTFEMAGDTFNYNGGNITGNPIMFMNNTLNIAPGSTGTGDFIFQSFSGGSSTLSGDLAAAQTVTIRGNDNSNGLLFVSTDFTNNGSITLDSAGSQGATLKMNSGTLTNGPTGEIHFQTGSGGNLARTLSADLVNNAGKITVEENVVAGLQRDLATYLNSGTISLHDGARLEVQAAGVRPFTNLPSGSIEGTGTLDVSSNGVAFSNEGEISPGFSAGVLNISGNAPFTSTASLRIEIGGPAVGMDYDQLAVTGNVSLDGNLEISLFGGFTPSPSDTFTILTGGAVAGAFANAPGVVTFTSGIFDVTYNPDSVVLSNYTVPEPSTAALLAFGVAVGLGRRRRCH